LEFSESAIESDDPDPSTTPVANSLSAIAEQVSAKTKKNAFIMNLLVRFNRYEKHYCEGWTRLNTPYFAGGKIIPAGVLGLNQQS
jgi:hypothetical protein